MIPETICVIVPHKPKPIPNDIGEYIAIDNSLPSGLVWIKRPSLSNPIKIGKPAGSLIHRAYYQFAFRGKRYLCHRVIHYLLTGEDPGDKYVDHHKNMSNIGTNLRPATPQQNQHNRTSHRNSTSKYKGVSWFKRDQRWKVQIALNGKQKGLGYYHNELDAAYAYNIAAKLLFGEYAKLNELPPEYNDNLFEYRDKVIKKVNELLANN